MFFFNKVKHLESVLKQQKENQDALIKHNEELRDEILQLKEDLESLDKENDRLEKENIELQEHLDSYYLLEESTVELAKSYLEETKSKLEVLEKIFEGLE